MPGALSSGREVHRSGKHSASAAAQPVSRIRATGLAYVAAALAASASRDLAAQAAPSGDARLWANVELGAGRATVRCYDCAETATPAGLLLSAAAGVTVVHGFGFAVRGDHWDETADAPQLARYLVAALTYATPRMPGLSAGIGLGQGRFWDDRYSSDSARTAPVASLGVTMRWPRSGVFGVHTSVNYTRALQTVRTARIAGFPAGLTYRPDLFSVRVGVGLASPTPAENRR